MKILFIILLFTSFFADGALAHAPVYCNGIFKEFSHANLSAEHFDYKTSNLWRYTFVWESTENISKFRENPNTVLKMPMVLTNPDEVEIIQFEASSPALLGKFYDGAQKIYWPMHPNNTYGKILYHGRTPEKYLETRYTSSRSLLSVEENTPAFTVKAGTNYPHQSELQHSKVFTKDDVDGALLRQPYIDALSKVLPKDDVLGLVPEALILRHKKSGEGVLIRNLSSLDRPDRIYITGLSIPYRGKEIAQKNNMDFLSFWKKNYSENLGRAKARLLLNYGIEMETPNSQNILVELTSEFKPTGKIIVRDTVDSYMYKPWLEALGLDNIAKYNSYVGYKPAKKLDTMSENSHWRFDEADIESFSKNDVYEMESAHDSAWIEEIEKLLQLRGKHFSGVDDVNKFLKSKEGQQAIKNYHIRLGTYPEFEKLNKNLYKEIPKSRFRKFFDGIFSLELPHLVVHQA